MPESAHSTDPRDPWTRSAFKALAAHIAVLGARGTIVAVNAAWERFGRAHGAQPATWHGLGLNYLEVCRRVALRQKDVLLREVAHRVKNNLQAISSLLHLQADAIDDPRLGVLFEASQERLHAMALVHDLLQQANDVARINLALYAARLTEELARTYAIDPARIALETQLEDVWVGLDTATPCGLLLHELSTNCFKHAFPAGRTGRIELRATAEQVLLLRVGDTGCGFPEEVDVRATDSLGLRLVGAMADQLRGTIALERAASIHVTITCPLAT